MNYLAISLLFLLFSCGSINTHYQSDIHLLTNYLKKGYAGADFLPKDQFTNVLDKLAEVDQSLSNNEFCKRIAIILDELVDGHIRVWNKDGACIDQDRFIGSVGDNDGATHNPDKIYSLRKINEKRDISVLSIRNFPSPNDARWNGIKPTIKEAMKSDVLIFDLRGNSGGDSGIAKAIARWLINDSIQHNKKKIYRKNTAESWMMYRNNIELIRARVSKKEIDISYFDEEFNEIDESIKASQFRDAPLYLVKEFESPDITKTNFNGKIYVLVDRGCGSTCEHTIELLRFHPSTELVGENSAGLIHFGQMGVVKLPKSGVFVSLSTQFFEGFKPGFYEKSGYPPDIKTPKNKDALVHVLEIIRSK